MHPRPAAATRAITPRHLVIGGGLLVWLALTVSGAREGTIPALFHTFVVVGVVVAVTSATRTVSLRAVFTVFCAGGFMMTVMYLVAKGYLEIDRDIGSNVRTLILPPIEELLKLAPVVGLLAWMRRTGTWAVGASDVLLLGVASAAGFGWVEDAYIEHNYGFERILWLPTAAHFRGNAIGGHLVWTGIAATFLGLAAVNRRARPLAALLAIGGFGFAWLSHTGNNYGNSIRSVDRLQDFFAMVTVRGWSSVVLFPFVVALAVAVDLLILRRAPAEQRPELPADLASWPLLERWAFSRDRRARIYARRQVDGAATHDRAEVERVVAAYDVSMWARALRHPAVLAILAFLLARKGIDVLADGVGHLADVGAQTDGAGPFGGAGGAAAGGAASGYGGGSGSGGDGDGGDGGGPNDPPGGEDVEC